MLQYLCLYNLVKGTLIYVTENDQTLKVRFENDTLP